MIEKTKYWDADLEKSPGFEYDIQDSFSQFYRVFSKPLVTDDVVKDASFSSWRGRFVCLYHFTFSIISEVFQTVKNVIALVYLSALTALDALNFAFSVEAREEFFIKVSALIGIGLGLGIRPIAFALDSLRLFGGFMINPSLAIGAKPAMG